MPVSMSPSPQPSRLILRASLLLNIGLAISVVVLLTHPREKTARRAPATPVGLESTRVRSSPPLTSSSGTPLPGETRNWVDALRTAGAPTEVIAKLVQLQFEDHWQSRLAAVQEKLARGAAPDQAGNALLREHDSALRQELRAALGEEAFEAWDIEHTLANLNLGRVELTPDEAERVYAMRRQTLAQLHALEQSRRDGIIDEAQLREQQRQAQASFNEQVNAVLGEDRFQAIQGNDRAALLRQQLQTLNPTAAQFAQLLDAQKRWSDQQTALQRQLQENKIAGTDYDAQLQALDAAQEREYRRVLGNDGYEAYQREQDTRYQMMKQNAAAWQLEPQQIDYVFRAIKSYEAVVLNYQQAQAVAGEGTGIDSAAVNNQLRQLTEQTAQTIKAYVGADRFARMQQNGVFPFGGR
jgi:hypothetical protein